MSPLMNGVGDRAAGALAGAATGAGGDFGASVFCAGAGVFCVGASAFCAGAADGALSSVRIRLPSDNLSPGFIFSSLMTPAAGDGTSIVALSDSSVISESSFSTLSPGLTSTSITGMFLKSPMSGTLTSINWLISVFSAMNCLRQAKRSSCHEDTKKGQTGNLNFFALLG